MDSKKLRLTKRMIEKLRDCHEKNLKSGNIPCLQEDLKGSLGALYKRGMVDTKIEDVNGKKLLCLYVTPTGIEFLNSIKNKE